MHQNVNPELRRWQMNLHKRLQGHKHKHGASMSKTPHEYPPAFDSLLAQSSSRGAAAPLLQVIVVISRGRPVSLRFSAG